MRGKQLQHTKLARLYKRHMFAFDSNSIANDGLASVTIETWEVGFLGAKCIEWAVLGSDSITL